MTTPRTDANEEAWIREYEKTREAGWPPIRCVVDSDFARELEREVQSLKATSKKSKIKRAPESDSYARFCDIKELIAALLIRHDPLVGMDENHPDRKRIQKYLDNAVNEIIFRFETMTYALEKVRGYSNADMGHQQMCDYVNEVASEALKFR